MGMCAAGHCRRNTGIEKDLSLQAHSVPIDDLQRGSVPIDDLQRGSGRTLALSRALTHLYSGPVHGHVVHTVCLDAPASAIPTCQVKVIKDNG